jgi:hypothetical protein
MRRLGYRTSALAGALVALASLAWAIPAGSASEPIRVTMLGDSVADSLQYMPSAEQLLRRGYAIHFDLRVCRRLASTGCPYDGAVPSSALDAIRDDRSSLGDVLVVDVGYNDDPALYRGEMDQLIHAAHTLGVKRVVWVTLRASSQTFRDTNGVIISESKRFPQVTVADWNAWSSGKPWFRSDGLHLTSAGATALAQFLRPYLAQAASEVHTASSATATA